MIFGGVIFAVADIKDGWKESEYTCSKPQKQTVNPKYLGGPPVDRDRFNAHPCLRTSHQEQHRKKCLSYDKANFLVALVMDYLSSG
ncbi:hypothetical protein TNCV_4733491 [Trichonephila clavipes]|nr:hypothetical protein TNCV_4733491 [Trichonephila clavipes]